MGILKWETEGANVGYECQKLASFMVSLGEIQDMIKEVQTAFLRERVEDDLDRQGAFGDKFPCLYGKYPSEIMQKAFPLKFDDYITEMSEKYPEGMPEEEASFWGKELFAVRDELALLVERIAPEISRLHAQWKLAERAFCKEKTPPNSRKR